MSRYRELDEIGRIQLSRSFYMRDFLFSEIGAAYAIPNLPDDLELAVYTGRKLCESILEPLQATFGRIHVRSGYRSSRLNGFGNKRGLSCSSNQSSGIQESSLNPASLLLQPDGKTKYYIYFAG